jgi:folate-dependent tRNA-U54 methylase TrmFO/GidA
MNVNFGIMDPIYGKFKDKRMKNAQLAERALADLVAATERVNALARNE